MLIPPHGKTALPLPHALRALPSAAVTLITDFLLFFPKISQWNSRLFEQREAKHNPMERDKYSDSTRNVTHTHTHSIWRRKVRKK